MILGKGTLLLVFNLLIERQRVFTSANLLVLPLLFGNIVVLNLKFFYDCCIFNFILVAIIVFVILNIFIIFIIFRF